MKKPKILLKNDDGIHAEGLITLYEALKEIGDITIVAPENEQSAIGHAITLYSPLRVKEVIIKNNTKAYAVNGTPADCVKIGVKAIMGEKPDLVVSGINRGSNLGMNIIYSGTVSVATEGVIMGIPSIAISLNSYQEPYYYDVGAEFALKVIPKILENGLPDGTLLNINIPNIPKEKIKGVRITKQGKSRFDEIFRKRTDPRNDVYYWLDGIHLKTENDDLADDIAIEENYISVTPINYDLTDKDFMEELSKWGL